MTTHVELVARAQRWVRSKHYPIVLADVRTNSISEQPDVIGFRTSDTMLVECKASRADFMRDAKKSFRRRPETGMGYYRWYFIAPEMADTAMDLIVEASKSSWGLAMPSGRSVSTLQPAKPFYERDLQSENRLLITALRRATEGWGRRMFGDVAPAAADGDPHPSTAKTIVVLRKKIASLEEQVKALRRSTAYEDAQRVGALGELHERDGEHP